MPFVPSLFEPDLKRQWALKHLENLRAEIDHFCDNNLYTVETEECRETEQYVIKLFHPNILCAVQAILTFGDFIGTLHTCLDYIASQLVLQNGSVVMTSTAFPTCERANHRGREKFQRATQGMSPAAIAVVESFQPYQLGNDYKNHPLWKLTTMCNIQKHRHIAAFTAKPPWQFRLDGDPDRENWVLNTEQIENCSIFRFPLAAKEFIEFNPEGIKTTLRFVAPDEGIDVGYEDLIAMYIYVANNVMAAFAGFFPDPCVPWHTLLETDAFNSGHTASAN